MSGPGEGKIHLGKADVYIHVKGKSGASVTHIDIELDKLNDIINPGENTYVGGKKGGVFLGLKRDMIQRIENSLSSKLTKTGKKFPVERAEKETKIK
ncbi:hypothetical protein COU60_04055 [Candidatus Pacearchaeota archaeon CG10_big_fil_rev_8_21_14_0_10_34_76]|nr:MAG: hypothetical protein COU60_04055 [Candidatus Pacearchaeota archaeon CG10_big_fil_rev_8_21_14_0_10_34_76]